MPVEFVRQDENCKTSVCDSTKLVLGYDGSGRRVSKTRYAKDKQFGYWYLDHVTHYTGIGTEVREAMRRSASPEVKVVVNLPQGLGRYMPEDAVDGLNGVSGSQLAGYRSPAKFEWYLKNHIGSTMLVYGTQPYNDKYSSYAGGVKAAYDYRAFGEQVDLTEPTDKVTENFTGKEKDDETELNYFGARYLDPMLGLWVSVDPARQHFSPYTYGSNNPIVRIDPDGNADLRMAVFYNKDQNGNALPSTLKSEVDRKLSQGLNPIYDTYKVKYFESSAKASDINNFINGGTYGALAIHGEYDEDFYYLHDGNGNEIYPDELKFNVKTLFGACYSKEYLNNRSDNHLVAPEYLPDGRTPSFVESIKFLLDNSDTQKLNESGYEMNFTGQ